MSYFQFHQSLEPRDHFVLHSVEKVYGINFESSKGMQGEDLALVEFIGPIDIFKFQFDNDTAKLEDTKHGQVFVNKTEQAHFLDVFSSQNIHR